MISNKLLILSIFFFLTMHQSIYCQSEPINIFSSNWQKVSFTLDVPPKFNLAQYRTLIIASVVDKRGRPSSSSEDVYDKLSARIQEIRGLHLLDRKNTQRIIKEFNFQKSGYVEEDFVTPFGKFYSSGIIMIGRLINSSYKDQSVKAPTIYSNVTERYRKASQTLSFSFQFIDLATSEIVYSNTLDIVTTFKTKKSRSTPPRINKNEVYTAAINELAQKFKNLFVLHEQQYNVELQKSSKFNDKLKKAATLIQLSEFDDARMILNEILLDKRVGRSDKVLSKAYYNIATLEFYTGNLSKAKVYAKKGYLKDSGNSKCLKLFKILN